MVRFLSSFSPGSAVGGLSSDAPSAASLRLAWFVSLLLAFAAAASIGYWGLRLLARPLPVPADARQVGRLDTDTLAAAAPRLFGTAASAHEKAAAAPARFRLWGVIGGGSQAGAALIGIDGKPPRAVAVGAEVTPGVWLDSTAYGQAVLQQDSARTELKVQPNLGPPSIPTVGGAAAYAQPQSSPSPGPAGASFLPNLAPGFTPRPPP
ncbi:MAG: general secretion pathway protein GspC [Proteobacteria bacterium]|nr:general secretion pathway protein GspC [Pseudomonadota bacterium]